MKPLRTQALYGDSNMKRRSWHRGDANRQPWVQSQISVPRKIQVPACRAAVEVGPACRVRHLRCTSLECVSELIHLADPSQILVLLGF